MWQTIGQSTAVSLLQRSLERGTLAHAYLLVGPHHVGKMTLALNLAQAVNCESAGSPCGGCASCRKIAAGKHADVQTVGLGSTEARARAEISIDQIREIQHSCNLPPFEGKSRVFIIDGAEQMSTEAANCLLKTLEEPFSNVMFVLLTANDRLLPTTVVSRCQRLELTHLAIAEAEAALKGRWGVDPEKAKLLAWLCHGCLGWAVTAAADDSVLRQRAERIDRLLGVGLGDYEERFAYAAGLAAQFGQNRALVWEVLDLWLDWWRDLLLVKTGCAAAVVNGDMVATLTDWARSYSLRQITDFVKGIQAAREQLKQNTNPRLALEVLMMSVPRRDDR